MAVTNIDMTAATRHPSHTSIKTITVQTSEGHDIRMEVAGIGSRSYAFTIDWHIRIILALAWLSLFWLLSDMGVLDFLNSLHDETLWSVYLVVLPPAAIYFLYHPVLEILMNGSTPGKQMAGVRIVSLNGRVPSVSAHIVRNIFRLLDSLPAFYVLGMVSGFMTKNEVRIGDLAAETVLVFDHKTSKGQIETAAQILSNDKLTAQDSELVVELLDRWQGLSKEVRHSLAVQLLSRLDNVNAVEDLNDAELKKHLSALVS